jgi:hypothetical protein
VEGSAAAGERLVSRPEQEKRGYISAVALYGAPSVLPDISPTGGEIGGAGAPLLFATLKLAKAATTIDLPPCGGDARQGRGGRRRAQPYPIRSNRLGSRFIGVGPSGVIRN